MKFREHKCEAEPSLSAVKQETKPSAAATTLADRARVLIKRGYTPKVAVELVLQETEVEHGNDPRIMERARADGEDFLQREAARASSELRPKTDTVDRWDSVV